VQVPWKTNHAQETKSMVMAQHFLEICHGTEWWLAAIAGSTFCTVL